MGWTWWSHLGRGQASYHHTDAREETWAVSLDPTPPPPGRQTVPQRPRDACLPFFPGLHSPSPGAEFRLEAVGSKESNRGAGEQGMAMDSKPRALGELRLR